MDKDSYNDKFADVRLQMLRFDLKGRGIDDPLVLKAMSQIRREEFVQPAYESQAYADGPLPIGMGQTISQPYIVGLMTQELRLKPENEVLEIGTGSGYQTAVLSRLAKKVYTIERLHQLSESAQAALERCGIANVEFYVGDGSCGWPEDRSFDRLIITAAVPQIPNALQEQLSDGGIIVGPVGGGYVQSLVVCTKHGDEITEKTVCDVRFVKVVGEYGFSE